MALETDYSSDRYELLPSFRFTLMVEGAQEIALKSVKPFQKENEYEYIEEGGMNDFVRIKRKHATKPHTIQVERYVNEDFYDPLPNGGADFVLPLLLFVGGNNAKSFGWSGSQRVFVFFGATVMQREMGGFDSERSGLLTETITIAYNQLYSMDIPGDTDPAAWTFEQGIKNKYANQGWLGEIAANKTKKNDLLIAAEKDTWHFGEDETEYTGNGVRHYEDEEKKVPQNKKTLKQSITTANAATWHFGKDETEYQGAEGARSYEDEEAKVNKNLVEKSKLSKSATGRTWRFGSGPDDYKGNDKRHADTGQPIIPQNKVEKSKLADEAKAATYRITDGVKGTIDAPEIKAKAEADTWKFGTDAGEYQGNGNMHAAHNENERTKQEIEANIRTWPEASYRNEGPTSKEQLLMS